MGTEVQASPTAGAPATTESSGAMGKVQEFAKQAIQEAQDHPVAAISGAMVGATLAVMVIASFPFSPLLMIMAALAGAAAGGGLAVFGAHKMFDDHSTPRAQGAGQTSTFEPDNPNRRAAAVVTGNTDGPQRLSLPEPGRASGISLTDGGRVRLGGDQATREGQRPEGSPDGTAGGDPPVPGTT